MSFLVLSSTMRLTSRCCSAEFRGDLHAGRFAMDFSQSADKVLQRTKPIDFVALRTEINLPPS